MKILREDGHPRLVKGGNGSPIDMAIRPRGGKTRNAYGSQCPLPAGLQRKAVRKRGRHRGPSQFWRSTRRAAPGIIGAWRKSSAHLHRPWRATIRFCTIRCDFPAGGARTSPNAHRTGRARSLARECGFWLAWSCTYSHSAADRQPFWACGRDISLLRVIVVRDWEVTDAVLRDACLQFRGPRRRDRDNRNATANRT